MQSEGGRGHRRPYIIIIISDLFRNAALPCDKSQPVILLRAAHCCVSNCIGSDGFGKCYSLYFGRGYSLYADLEGGANVTPTAQGEDSMKRCVAWA